MSSKLSKEVKDVILRVYEFCKEEQYNRLPIIPLNRAQLRVATATGVSIHTVATIAQEGKYAALTGTKIGEGKERNPRKGKEILSDFDVDLIQDIIQGYYNEHQKWPSVTTLLPILRKQIGYNKSRETLRKSLREIDYYKGKDGKYVAIRRVDRNPIIQTNNSKHVVYHDHDYIKI